MLIALPNPDLSFTATLFAPYEGPDGFDNIDATNPQAVDGYFNRHFPDVVHLMPEVRVYVISMSLVIYYWFTYVNSTGIGRSRLQAQSRGLFGYGSSESLEHGTGELSRVYFYPETVTT